MTLNQKRIAASLLFLLAALIVFSTATYYHLQSKYPTSTEFIQRNLESPVIAEQFRVEEAKKAGYSEKEITEFLAQRNSRKLREYMYNILLIESAVFLVSLLVGIGLIILKPANKIRRSKGIVSGNSKASGIQQESAPGKDKTSFSASPPEGQRINSKYCKWLISSVIASIILFGGFIYAKGGDVVQLWVLLITWGVGFINVFFWSAIIPLTAKARKKN